jgi:hypothetical protein
MFGRRCSVRQCFDYTVDLKKQIDQYFSQLINKSTNQPTKQRINKPTFISSFLPNKVHFKNPPLLIEKGITQQSPYRSSPLTASLPMAVRLELPKLGARLIEEDVAQADSFRSHAKHLQAAIHRIAAGGKKNPNQKEKTPDRRALGR